MVVPTKAGMTVGDVATDIARRVAERVKAPVVPVTLEDAEGSLLFDADEVADVVEGSIVAVPLAAQVVVPPLEPVQPVYTPIAPVEAGECAPVVPPAPKPREATQEALQSTQECAGMVDATPRKKRRQRVVTVHVPLVEEWMAGPLIGAKGATVAALQSTHHVKIDVLKKTREFTVKGKRADVDAAIAACQEVIAEAERQWYEARRAPSDEVSKASAVAKRTRKGCVNVRDLDDLTAVKKGGKVEIALRGDKRDAVKNAPRLDKEGRMRVDLKSLLLASAAR